MITEKEARQLDTVGGHHNDGSGKWPAGSCWENEGLYLYRTVRELRPAVIVEVGRFHGCSTSHLALGCKHNEFGRVYSIDINAGAGERIPAELREWVEFVNADIFQITKARRHEGTKARSESQISAPSPSSPSCLDASVPSCLFSPDLLLEDGEHSVGFTKHVLTHFRVRPGGRVIVHDVRHPTVPQVYREAVEVLGEPTEIFFEPPSDCGYGVWVMGERHEGT